MSDMSDMKLLTSEFDACHESGDLVVAARSWW